MDRRLKWIAAAFALAAGAFSPTLAQRTERPIQVRTVTRPFGEFIPNRYIVTVAPRNDPGLVASNNNARMVRPIRRVFNGFVATMDDTARDRLLRDKRVLLVEQDSIATINSTANSWGIDRIDQRVLPVDGKYNPPATGVGVNVFVVDTGIRFDHIVFGGRAVRGIDVIGDGRNGADCNGHGTHVAGTIGGGAGYGVAPDVTLVSARVLNCSGSGSVSGIIYALDWIAQNAQRPAVVNMSLGGTVSASLDNAVTALVQSGITAVVAAGNENTDACLASPSRAAAAITVAASDRYDARASFSNFGNCVDVFAPGVSITSSYWSSPTSMALMSGTSMASPHVAGRAALLLETNPSMTPGSVATAVVSTSTGGVISGSTGSPNRLLYTGAGTTTTSPPPTTDPPAPPPAIGSITVTLSFRYSSNGQPIVSLRWAGATRSHVDVYRNGVRTTTTPNDGVYSDRPRAKGIFRYKVCDSGTTNCSAESSVTV